MDELDLINRLWVSVKQTFTLLANILSFAVLGVLIINFLWGPWPAVSSNPIWDILFVRSGGPFLYANHVSVELAVCLIAGYFMIKNPKQAWKWIIVIFATASIHEMILSVVSYPVSTSILYLIYSPFTYRWIAWLSVTLVIAILLSNKWQRKKLWQIAVIVTVIEVIWIFAIVLVPFNPRSIIEYQPGPALLSFPENFFEVVSWLVPLFWWLKK